MGPIGARFRHEALLYQGPEGFADRVARFVRDGVAAGEPVLVAVTDEHADTLRERLGGSVSGVEFLSAAAFGPNPARIVPAWREWARGQEGRSWFRGVSEPATPEWTDAYGRACGVHEHLVNLAFDAGPGWHLLCPYEVAETPAPVLEGVGRAHPVVSGPDDDAGAGARQSAFDPLGAFTAFEEPLPELGPPVFEALFTLADLPPLRAAVREHAQRLGLRGNQVADFVLVADELACNSVRHGGGDGRLSLWALDGYAVCEVDDKGLIIDPLVGRRRPDLSGSGTGAGLWSANQLCDLVLIRSVPGEGTGVRAYVSVR